MLKITALILVTFCISGFQGTIKAQSFGFGCLGLVGGYGGYSYQVYKPAGLNEYIQTWNLIRNDSLLSPMNQFGKAKGFRVGLNLYRANLEGLILTAKGFYQLVIEKHGSSIRQSSSGNASVDFEIKMKSWGVGFDLGTEITKIFSWKVIDAAILFNDVDLGITENFPGAVTEVMTYSSDPNIGYSVGTGFILTLINRYVSLEGLVAYTVLEVDKLSKSDGTPFLKNENSTEPMNNFIEGGGFNAVVQLNISFPL